MNAVCRALVGHLYDFLTFFDEQCLSLRAEAQARQITLPQLLAAALTESLLERFDLTLLETPVRAREPAQTGDNR